jgi:hypothetical protein
MVFCERLCAPATRFIDVGHRPVNRKPGLHRGRERAREVVKKQALKQATSRKDPRGAIDFRPVRS